MKVLGTIVAVVIAFIAVGAALHYLQRTGVQAGAAAVVTAPLSVTKPAAAALPVGTGVGKNSETITIHGTAILDTSSGTPAVPYISYTDVSGNTATKQLIFADTRGCSPGAGDLPCVPSYPANNAYPKITTGEKISVTGYIREDRFLITSMSTG